LKKTNLVFLIVFGLLFISMTTSMPVQAKPDADAVRFAIIFATGGLGDLSFNDAAMRGVKMAEDKYNTTIWIDYVQPHTQPEFAPYQEALSKIGYDDENGSIYELIICVGFLQTWALNDTAKLYPLNDYVLIDESVLNKSNPNVKGITFKEHEGSFLVGAMAGMTTETDKIGFFGGMQSFLIDKFKAGYTHGAKFVNPDVNVSTSWAPNQDNPWLDVAGGRSVAQAFYEDDNDIVYAAAGLSGFGVIQEANATDDVYAIGVDSNQDHLSEGKVLCSMLKLVERAVFESIDAKMKGTYTSDNLELGLDDGGVGISPMEFTQEEANEDFFFQRYCETKTRYEWVQNFSDQIIAGDIVVALQPDDVPSDQELAFNTSVTCPEAPIDTEATTTAADTEPADTTTEDTESIPASGFELIGALGILCCTSVFIRRRLRK
jgi:basic membrane protein A